MISSESINFSRYSPINRNNSSNSNDSENNNLNNENKNNDLEHDSDIIENEKDNDKIILVSENEKNKYLFYGNHKEIINPIKIGNCFAFFYNSNGRPLITIGPDCKNIF